ncbi:hypothetical protein GCM10025788_02210 [Serinicoccus chungangensis]
MTPKEIVVKRVPRSIVAGTFCLFVAACGSDPEGPVSTPTETGVPQSASETGELKVQSGKQMSGVEALFEAATEGGLECEEVEETTAETHDVWVCDSQVLLAYFSDSGPMDGYVEGYLEKGQDVIRGDAWFIAGRPERIEALTAEFTG